MYSMPLKRLSSFKSLYLTVIICIYVTGLDSEPDYYRAAVLEHVRFFNISYPPTEIVKKNIDIYEIAANSAALNGADIIVFPEWGLYPHLKENRSFLYEFVEDIPDPKRSKTWNPCKQKDIFFDRPILTKLSCMAKDNGIFIVANIADQKNCRWSASCDADGADNCNTNDFGCPEDGMYLFNTNVVFNREGTLVARYYKRHLFFELDMNTPQFPEEVFFETDFGNFTTVICFDLMFKESLLAVEKSGVVNLAYPTYWYDHAPFLFFATPYQQAWAMANRINLLAANVQCPGTGTTGSGIYSANRGALIYTHNPDGRHKLLISNVPKSISEDTTDDIPLNAKRFIIENGKAVEVQEEEDIHFDKECGINVRGKANDALTDYRCHPSSVDHFDFVKLKGNEGRIERCSNGFCCSVSYSSYSMDEDYYLGYTGENLNYNETFSHGVQVCFLSRCESFGGYPCMNYVLKSNTAFKEIILKGNFSTKYVFPFAVDSNVRLTDRNIWHFDRHSTIEYHNLDKNSSLLFFGLYGRKFDQDVEFHK